MYKKWKESTTHSSSGRHLGHHHALLVPDGEQYDKDKIHFSDTMWCIHNNITNIVRLKQTPLTRWILSLVIILPKDSGRPRIHRIRLINTYESDYDMVLKLCWPNNGLKNTEEQKWLGINQAGGRNDMPAIETATINEMIIEYHRITRQPLCTHQDDAAACYDRIVMNNAIISNCKYLIRDNVCKVNNLAQKHMVYKLNHKATHQNIATIIQMNYHFMAGDKNSAMDEIFGASSVFH